MASTEEGLEPRQCPYCRCTFVPTDPDQVYCSSFCEEEHRRNKP